MAAGLGRGVGTQTLCPHVPMFPCPRVPVSPSRLKKGWPECEKSAGRGGWVKVPLDWGHVLLSWLAVCPRTDRSHRRSRFPIGCGRAAGGGGDSVCPLLVSPGWLRCHHVGTLPGPRGGERAPALWERFLRAGLGSGLPGKINLSGKRSSGINGIKVVELQEEMMDKCRIRFFFDSEMG